MKTTFLNPIIIGMLIVSVHAVDIEPAHRVFLTADACGDVPKESPAESFDCHQKIYVVLEGAGLKKDKHIFEGFWINPKGKQQEYARYEFEASKGKKRVWLWLELHPSGGKLFGAITPSYGVDIFSGRWTVRLYLDGNFLTEKVFYVSC
ncbi:MAG: hypothetical protein HZA00_03560 [Nitrospinae bacterium]|nr:hypothetical protein [Nitrospinota bacterium]